MTTARARTRWHADLALIFITLIWGSTFAVVKEALDYASVLLFLALRFSLAAVALTLVFRRQYPTMFQRRAVWRGGLAAGLCLFAGYFLQTLGLRYTTASKSAFITGLSVVLVPSLSAIVYRKRPRWQEVVGVLVATTGLGLLTLRGWDLHIGVGDLLTVACAFAFSAHVLVLGRYSRQVGFEGLSLIQISTVAAVSLASFWWAETPRVVWHPTLVTALVITGLLATALAFTVQSWAQQHTTPTRTALILALEPVFAAITSFLVAGEMFTPRSVLGGALILGGIVVVQLKPAVAGRHP
jgi:drug/metabolite transporter (DMT)-like permease